MATALPPYASSTAEKFAPGNFVTSYLEGKGPTIGVTLAVRNPIEANPLIHVRWLPSCETEWVRAQYLYLAK